MHVFSDATYTFSKSCYGHQFFQSHKFRLLDIWYSIITVENSCFDLIRIVGSCNLLIFLKNDALDGESQELLVVVFYILWLQAL